jgi:hypothetical protein
MNIGSHQALVNLLASEHIVSMDRLKDCLQQVSKICSCQKQRKNQKHEECNVLYINFVISHASDLIDYFRTKTTDNEIIFSHGSNHIIKTIKLR